MSIKNIINQFILLNIFKAKPQDSHIN